MEKGLTLYCTHILHHKNKVKKVLLLYINYLINLFVREYQLEESEGQAAVSLS